MYLGLFVCYGIFRSVFAHSSISLVIYLFRSSVLHRFMYVFPYACISLVCLFFLYV